jgi:hypothetical protein
MNENLILNFREVLMHEGITRTINRNLDSEPPCPGASVREEVIEPSASRSTYAWALLIEAQPSRCFSDGNFPVFGGVVSPRRPGNGAFSESALRT